MATGLLLCAQVVDASTQESADTVQIEYQLTIDAPATHLYSVEIEIRGVHESAIQVAMPAWAPGEYRIRNFSRNVQNFQARRRSGGQSLEWNRTDKQTWEIEKPANADVVLSYEVFSPDLTPRMADISGAATYMYVVGHTDVPVALRYEKPRAWDIHTGLERRKGAYQASSYDALIDARTFAVDAQALEFELGDVEYRLVFSDPFLEFNEEQLVTDIRDIVEAGVALFGPAPFEAYTFLLKVLPVAASTGTGHLNSAWIVVGEADFSSGPRYERFLYLVAQQFVRAWNGKRIRPASESRIDYTREAHTHLLWATDGLTRYYARRLLLQAEILDPRAYLTQIGQEIDWLQHQPGRFLMSLEEASWNVWTPSDNRQNNSIAHERKGEIAGLLLDIEIRARTGGEQSLDDVMRHLMETYAIRGVGVPEDGFLEALNTVTGSNFADFYASAIRSRGELDYALYASQAALSVRAERQLPTLYMGIQVTDTNGLAQITRVYPESPAEDAGFDIGDILVGFEDRRVTFSTFQSEFRRRKLGETLTVTVMRAERLVELRLEPGEIQPEVWRIVEAPNPDIEQVELRNGWMGPLY